MFYVLVSFRVAGCVTTITVTLQAPQKDNTYYVRPVILSI